MHDPNKIKDDLKNSAKNSGGQFFDDMLKMFSGAASTADAARHEAEGFFKERGQQFFQGLNLVTREEFDRVQEMAVKAREENEKLRAELEALKGEMAGLSGNKKPASKTKS